MWYKNSFRRHLCDMHIDDWNEEFLSKFSPEDYFENLKKAKIQNAMIYFQSHVGLCYYPTKSGKMHNAFKGREDMIKRLVDMCRKNGISVTGYYSLIYNNWAAHEHPEWRMLREDGTPKFNFEGASQSAFADNDIFRYGLCCPNNNEYRSFVSKQIKEIVDYFEFDGMFFDMLFWPHVCYCDSCKRRWSEEVGGEIPMVEDWNDENWLLHMKKRREWIGEFAQWATDLTKELIPGVSVEHNVAYSALPSGKTCNCEEVIDACDYAGGDLYGGSYCQSFTCKFYRNITKNQPFEYMFSRCEPNLSKHTITKSEDAMLSSVFLTAAHHGATLAIDAIDPKGTMDSRVYERLGRVFEREMPYEKYFKGDMIEDIGIYYTLRSKFNAHGESYTNHSGCVNSVETMIKENICCGVTGGYHDISKYRVLIAPCLTEEDKYDYDRIIKYVKDGGKLYISGGDCKGLLKEFFGAEVKKRTREKVVYIAPGAKAAKAFGWFTENYPLHFDGRSPIVEGIDESKVCATLTLPYTPQDIVKFASIHSNPPGIKTDIPSMAVTDYGKGRVLWSALPIESIGNPYEYSRVFVDLLKELLGLEQTVFSDAPKDVEIVAFRDGNEMTVSSVLLSEDFKARRVEPFEVCVKADRKPSCILQLPQETAVTFEYENGTIKYLNDNLDIFDMKKIIF